MPMTAPFPPKHVEYCPDPRWPWNPVWCATIEALQPARVEGGELRFEITANNWQKHRFGLRRWWRWLFSMGPLA